MRKLHAATFSGKSGISRYAVDFHDLVLSPRGYERLEVGSGNAADGVASDDIVHIEIGVNQTAEIELLYELIRRKHQRVDVTLHDPPFVRWPHFRFERRIWNSAAKFVQLYFRNFGIGTSDLRTIRRFFVLTRKGCESVKRRYGFDNVHYCPFVLRPEDVRDANPAPLNLLYFGFISKNKGLDYALALHEGLLPSFPDARFVVIGDAINPDGAAYLAELRRRYTRNVDYLGFVDDARLAECFDRGSLALLPFAAYKSVVPASASVLGAMKMGKVVVATNVNAVSEFVRDGDTGYLLTGEPAADIAKVRGILTAPERILSVAQVATRYLRAEHDPHTVGRFFDCAESGSK